MRTHLLMATALVVALTSVNLGAQERRRTEEPANRPAGEPDRRRTDTKEETKKEERRGEQKQVAKHDNNRDKKSEVVHTTREKVVYKKSPKVHVVRHLPANYRHCRHRDYDYYENDGRYYNFNNGKYILIAPPVGMRVRYLPLRHVRVYHADRSYFYFNGVFYTSTPFVDEYEIIEPPVGAIVSELPYDAEKIEIDDRIYYEYNNTIYKKVHTEYGKAYEVVGKL